MGGENEENNIWQSIVALEKSRFDILKEIESARLNLQHEYAEKRMKLLKENQAEMEWLLEGLGDLRKERMKFQKKALPEIAEALNDSKVPEEIVHEWLGGIADQYNKDLSLAQELLAADIESVDEELFTRLKSEVEERLEQIVKKKAKKIEEAQVEATELAGE